MHRVVRPLFRCSVSNHKVPLRADVEESSDECCALECVCCGSHVGCTCSRRLWKKKSSVSDGLGEGASITISGQLALENSSTAASLNLADLNAASNLDVDALKVYCVSFAFPPKAGTGDVDASGNFSLNIDANGVSIGCFILNGTDTLATVVFEDTSSKNVDGNAKSDARLAFSGNTSMGTIKVDTATGKAKADVANFKSAVKAFSGSGFDFTGTWKLKAADNLPEGYQTAIDCSAGSKNCEGPAKGMVIFF